ncbi:uncharacterized protein LOC126184472, partial [Schistocerca cancellata]|uniref:uncharacterized protein LOC126184472 n=1 Tax=Schistocerca cancellata TaxID=274614 RepID=UPI002118433F
AARINASRATLPCAVLAYGGRYTLRLDPPQQLPDRSLDVRWPRPELALEPSHIQTFPSQPVSAALQFARTACAPATGFDFPDLWLQLLFCGHSKQNCHVANVTRTQVLFRRQVKGYPERVLLTLACDLFGIAGYYALTLTEAAKSGLQLLVGDPAYLKAAWSDQFVFNVHARSVFPCEDGVSVLFQYPECILASADRIRVFARLRADVASVAPPSTLVYAAEARVTRGQHALRFPCSVFSERYVEYCFVYVSQAVTGAVSDLRVDCVPTMPVSEGEAGNWGAWSAWSACSATCAGSRNRYRICDNPPPRYGAKFCQGRGYESEPCGAEDCADGAVVPGPGCRCGGCQLRVRDGATATLAASSTSCPGRSLWLLQADDGWVLKLTFEHVVLPCGSHWLKVRDGDSLSATLLAQLSGRPHVPLTVISEGPFLLIEFFSDVPLAVLGCSGSFVARATPLSSGNETDVAVAGAAASQAAAAGSAGEAGAGAAGAALAGRVGALVVGALTLAAGLALGAQYVLRYRQYRLAVQRKPASACSLLGSTLTLLSDVVSLRRSHRRLPDCEPDDDHTDNEYEVIEPLQPDVKDFKTASVKSCGSSEKAEKNSRSSAEVVVVKPTSSRASGPPVTSAASSNGLSSNNSDKLTSERRNQRKRLDTDVTAARSAPARIPVATAEDSLSQSEEIVSSPKARKDLTNRECQLAGSEFSLSGPDHDLELDYYDYNVTNAGGIPGSLLGMDPAYLLWIPPFAPGCWEEEGDNLLSYSNQPELQSQHELHVFPLKGEYYTQVPPSVCKDQQVKDEVTTFCSTDVDKLMDNKTASTGNISTKDQKTDTNNAANTIRLSDSMSKLIGPLHHQEYSKVGSLGHVMNVRSKEDVMLKEFSKKSESPVKVHQICSVNSKESTLKKLSSAHADILDNIQFADEDEEDESKCDSLII